MTMIFKFKVKIFKNDLLVLAFQSEARHDEEIKNTFFHDGLLIHYPGLSGTFYQYKTLKDSETLVYQSTNDESYFYFKASGDQVILNSLQVDTHRMEITALSIPV